MKNFNVLLVDDDDRIRTEVAEFLREMEYTVYQADRPSKAHDILLRCQVDLMIIDINLPEKDGLTYLKEVKQLFPPLEVIVITAYADVDKAVNALRLGAIDFLNKPLKLVDLQSTLVRTKKYVELSNTIKVADNTIDVVNNEFKKVTEINFIGKSKAAEKIIEDVQMVAQSAGTSVLITGESGTGKELVARSIHLLSTRVKHPFLAVNSSAIPESLFESELFGYKKGAFTGASDSRPGWFEQANKGTLFLDEISEMNPALQSKLLRVLEDRKVRRLGSESETEFDVRIISASNQNFTSIIKQNKFRQDLYYRLAVFIIKLPPLRERKDDIPQLVEYYVNHFAGKMNKKITGIEREVFEVLSNYYFPGNIRELRNLIERSVIKCSTGIVSLQHFDYIDTGMHSASSDSTSLDLEENEKNLIIKAMQKAGNNKAQAAKLLNITWQSLDRRLSKFNLNTAEEV